MKKGYQKYIPFKPINIPDRTWPNIYHKGADLVLG